MRTRTGAMSLAVLLAAACCTDGEVRKDEVPQRPAPHLRLLVVTDLGGTLEPCGCTSRPLGGIDRLAAAVAEERGPAAPTLMVSAGDLFFGPGHHGEGELPTQELWKAETTVQILSDLGLHAANLGPRDLTMGRDHLASLREASRFPWLAAGLKGPSARPDRTMEEEDAGAPSDEGTRRPPEPLPALTMHELGDLQVGVIGVIWPDPSIRHLDAFGDMEDPLELGRQAAIEAREGGADLVVALSTGDRRAARRLAAEPSVDLVVQGGLDEDEPVPPMASDGGLVLHAARHGRGLLAVDLWWRGPDDGWTDVGALGRQSERERLERAAEALRGRIAQWEEDPQVDRADLDAQRARLRSMEADLEQAERAGPLPETGNVTAARFRELPEDAPRDPSVTNALDTFFRRVNEHNRQAFADRAPPPVPDGAAGYVGSETCGACHEAAHAWWTRTPHGNAYATLVERHKQFNLECVSCHVTGYGEPGGATVTHVDDLKNVGCESCHGPGSAHVESGGESLAHMRTEVPERVCVGCHNEEHSDLFNYRAYRQTLLVPGHGLPEEAPEVAP